jgi:apolipoprotein N-acyltransferase
MAGGLLLWASFPPLGWWPLAWIALVPWLILIRVKHLPGRRPYAVLAVACFLHWLILLQGIRLAHPALYLGWFALAAYLSIYPLAFIALSRVAVQRLGLSLVLVAPVVWTGLELARGYLLTGFSMALLGHTQVAWTTLIQIADVFGAYGVGFLVVLVSACLVRAWPATSRKENPDATGWTWWPAAVATLAGGAALLYGTWRQSALADPPTSAQPLRIALIQGSFDTVFADNPDRADQVFERYLQLTERAIQSHPNVDLVVWPESAFTGTLGELLIDGNPTPPPDVPLNQAEYRRRAEAYVAAFQAKTQTIARRLNQLAAESGARQPDQVHLLVGVDTQVLGTDTPRRYNAALLIAPDGRVSQRYFKMHRVAFGEYIPLGDMLPWLYRLTPMTHGLTPGPGPRCFRVAGASLAPSICFESTVPHLIRRQLSTLRDARVPVELLACVTNDGWFWGSNILDLHLACAIFRAVEHRLPMVVAANTGLSAHIDRSGSVLARGPRRQEAILYAEVDMAQTTTWYQQIGDLPALACLLFCLAVAVIGLVPRRSGALTRKTLE